MAKQTSKGKAFEYILGRGICDHLNIELRAEDGNLEKYIHYWNDESSSDKEKYESLIPKIIEYMVPLDSCLRYANNIMLASDKRARNCDNRDIVTVRDGNVLMSGGASNKKNSTEVYGGRLKGLEEWITYPSCICNFDTIINNLCELATTYNKFSEIESLEKTNKLYIPTLDCISSCLEGISENEERVKKLFHRFVGIIDHIQVEYYSKQCKSYIRNFLYTLWDSSFFPSRICNVEKKYNSENTLIVRFNGGWTFNIRVKNGDSKIRKSSIKFSITMETCPIDPKIISI